MCVCEYQQRQYQYKSRELGGRLEKRAKSTKVKDCAAETETLTVGLLLCVLL